MRIINFLGYGFICIRSGILYFLWQIKKRISEFLLRIHMYGVFNLSPKISPTHDFQLTLR